MHRRGYLSPSTSSVPLCSPDSALENTVEAYRTLDKAKLKTELALVYELQGFKVYSGALALMQVFMENNPQDTFSETVRLLKILITNGYSRIREVLLYFKEDKNFP